jgi:hypothetical protein
MTNEELKQKVEALDQELKASGRPFLLILTVGMEEGFTGGVAMGGSPISCLGMLMSADHQISKLVESL